MLHLGIAGRAAPVAVASQGGLDDAALTMMPGQAVWLTWKTDAKLVMDAELQWGTSIFDCFRAMNW